MFGGSCDEYLLRSLSAADNKDKFKKMAQRRQSAPSVVIRSVLNRSMRFNAHSPVTRDEHSDNHHVECLPFNFKASSNPINLAERQYVREGRVLLATGMHTQERYLFLFTDLLLIAKSKSTSNYKLKHRVKLSDLWLTACCTDEVSEVAEASDRSFTIGWPTTNTVATFSSVDVKQLWWNDFNRLLNESQEAEEPKCVNIRIVYQHAEGSSAKVFSVHTKQTAKDVIDNSLQAFGIEENSDNYQLWVSSGRDGTPCPLIGQERPHAIKMCCFREALAAKAYASYDIATDDLLVNASAKSGSKFDCNFVLRQKQTVSSDHNFKRSSRLKAKTPSLLFGWARKRSLSRGNDCRHDGVDSPGSTRTYSDPCESCGMITTLNATSDASLLCSPTSSCSSPESPKLFAQPLSCLCADGFLPQPIMSMLEILYHKGPSTNGIFRKSGNVRMTRLLKEKINQEPDYDMTNVHVHVIAALIKDFLRSVPGSVLGFHNHRSWTKVCELLEPEQKIQEIKRLLGEADGGTRAVLRYFFCVLHNIAKNSDHNNMTSYNLAVCIAPSLLWVDKSNDLNLQAECSKAVQELAEFMIDNCLVIFGEESLLKFHTTRDHLDDEPPKQDGSGETSGEESCSLNGEADGVTEYDSKDDKEDEDSKILLESFDRSRVGRRQIQRKRHSKKLSSSASIEASSMDSLDQDFMEAQMLVNEAQLELKPLMDKYDCKTGFTDSTCPTHRRLSADVCSLSNDSGFTTLSGDDEDGRRNRSFENMVGASTSSVEDLMIASYDKDAAELEKLLQSAIFATIDRQITKRSINSERGVSSADRTCIDGHSVHTKDTSCRERRCSEPAFTKSSTQTEPKKTPDLTTFPLSPSKTGKISLNSVKPEKEAVLQSSFAEEKRVNENGKRYGSYNCNDNNNNNNNKSIPPKFEENCDAPDAFNYLQSIRLTSVDSMVHLAGANGNNQKEGSKHGVEDTTDKKTNPSSKQYTASPLSDSRVAAAGIDVPLNQLNLLHSAMAKEGCRHTVRRSSFTHGPSIERMSNRRCSDRAWRKKTANEIFYFDGKSMTTAATSNERDLTAKDKIGQTNEIRQPNDSPTTVDTKLKTDYEKPKSAFIPFTASFSGGVSRKPVSFDTAPLPSVGNRRIRERHTSAEAKPSLDTDSDTSQRRRRRHRPKISSLGEALGSRSVPADGASLFSSSLPSRGLRHGRGDAIGSNATTPDCCDSDETKRANLNKLLSFDERLRASSSLPGLPDLSNKNRAVEDPSFDRCMNGSVRAKINAFNQGLVQSLSKPRSSNRDLSVSSHQDSLITDALLFQHQQSRKTSMPASYVNLDTILQDFDDKEMPSHVEVGHASETETKLHRGRVRTEKKESESNSERVNNHFEFSKICVSSTTDNETALDENKTVSRLSDETLQNLSAIVAFGNLKMPRSMFAEPSSAALCSKHEPQATGAASPPPRRRSRRKRGLKNVTTNASNNDSNNSKRNSKTFSCDETFKTKLKELENAEESYV